jgi:hypothetical protein
LLRQGADYHKETTMKRAAFIGACGLLAPLLGCPGFLDQTSVRLVNNASFPVDVTVFIDDDQNILRALLTGIGTELNFTVQPGDTVAFTRSCDDLQAIVIDDAELRVLGGIIRPNEDTEVFRDGDDFGCGDVLTFTFTRNLLGTDLQIAFAATSSGF